MKKLISFLICTVILLTTVGVSVIPAAAQEAPPVPQIRVTTEAGNGIELQKDDGYVNAQITITDTDGSVLSDACTFKVRGNTTAMTFVQKKAFTFKFNKKKDVLGMGKGKKWALLANAFDPTLLRNYMSFELARELGLAYTSEQRFVELWVDDSYRGCYTLYEPVQEGSDRVDIDIESNEGKKDFLIEYEANRVEEDTTYFTAGGLRFIASDPDEPDDAQLAYITDTVTGIVDTLKNGTREEIEAAIDVPSFASFYLLNEYLKTMDFDSSSVFFYYKDGVLYAGPAWDYDMSTGNTNADLASQRAKRTSYTDGIIQDRNNFYRYLCDKSWFMDEVKRVYEANYDYIESISADGGLLDTWRAENSDLFDRNYTAWSVKKWWYNYQKQPLATYEDNFVFFKNWCRERNEWLSNYYELFSYEFLRGDADGDGSVDIYDATTVQRLLAQMQITGDERTAIRAAVTDTELSVADATVIQRYVAEMGNPYALDTVVKVSLR